MVSIKLYILVVFCLYRWWLDLGVIRHFTLLVFIGLVFWCCEEETIPTEVSLWGDVYSLESTTELDLRNNQLTGSIPSEIGNLTNLTYLKLSSNQLSGIIPDEICNQGDSSPGLSNNQLCPPYPTCVEDFVGEQDTTNCN